MHARRGQSIVEYIILVAIFAIASIGIVITYGDRVREMISSASDQLAGEQFKEPEKTIGPEKKTLEDFAKTDGVKCNGSVCIGGP
ncbi:MAG: hypothetical protein QM817_21605 [Archangium sp.]